MPARKSKSKSAAKPKPAPRPSRPAVPGTPPPETGRELARMVFTDRDPKLLAIRFLDSPDDRIAQKEYEKFLELAYGKPGPAVAEPTESGGVRIVWDVPLPDREM